MEKNNQGLSVMDSHMRSPSILKFEVKFEVNEDILHSHISPRLLQRNETWSYLILFIHKKLNLKVHFYWGGGWSVCWGTGFLIYAPIEKKHARCSASREMCQETCTSPLRYHLTRYCTPRKYSPSPLHWAGHSLRGCPLPWPICSGTGSSTSLRTYLSLCPKG